ncbi:MAG: hypothetical protein GX607_18260 [Myxococcales bacterium]|jgi:hypothetical protein|nr:hypothetical protein [Myxococcales bacterium]
MRVGPKGLERAIPDVHSACQPCAEAVRSLERLLRATLPTSAPVEHVTTFVLERLAQVEAALERASSQSMIAKNRLALEQVLGQVLPDLEGGRDLLELLAEAVWAPPVPTPMIDLLSIGQVPPSAAPTVRVKLDARLADLEVVLPPSLVQGCFNILASAYQAHHGQDPSLHYHVQGTEVWLELNTSELPGTWVIWPLQPVLEPSLAVTVAALRTRGCDVVLGEAPRVRLPGEILRDPHGDP